MYYPNITRFLAITHSILDDENINLNPGKLRKPGRFSLVIQIISAIKRGLVNKYARVGDDVELTCICVGDVQASVSWTENYIAYSGERNWV